MFKSKGVLAVGLLAATLALYACQQSSSKKIKTSVTSNVTTSDSSLSKVSGVTIFSGNTLNAKISIENPNAIQPLVTNTAEIIPSSSKINPGAEHAVTRAMKNADGITFTWQDTWRAALNFELNTPVNLTEYLNEGAVEFDLRVNQLNKGGVAFKRPCHQACERPVPFLLSARAIVGQGWKSFSVPVSCFVHEGDSLSAVSEIFSIETGGAGDISVANVRLVKQSKFNLDCPDYKTQSVTASPLNEWWSIDWWMTRHEKKLQELATKKAAAQPVDLVFVGDSITEGWEKSGAPVWQKYYANRNAIALGFGGDRTENLLWRLQHGEIDGIDPKLVVMMIGTNNNGHRREDSHHTAIGIERDIKEIQTRLPKTKILLLAIFPRDEQADGEMRLINERTNQIIQTFADNQKIFFLNINRSFLTEQGVLSKEIMPDLLHPNEQGYEIWAKAMEPTLSQLLK